MAVRTWAPRGQTPILRVKLTRDHLSAISGITLDGRLFMQVRPDSYDAEAVVGFLRVLLRKISGKIVLIWDGSPIHRAHEIKDFLKRGAAKRLHLELSQASRTGQCLLFRFTALVPRDHSCQRAFATQKGDHSELLSPMWLLALVPSHEISSTARRRRIRRCESRTRVS